MGIASNETTSAGRLSDRTTGFTWTSRTRQAFLDQAMVIPRIVQPFSRSTLGLSVIGREQVFRRQDIEVTHAGAGAHSVAQILFRSVAGNKAILLFRLFQTPDPAVARYMRSPCPPRPVPPNHHKHILRVVVALTLLGLITHGTFAARRRGATWPSRIGSRRPRSRPGEQLSRRQPLMAAEASRPSITSTPRETCDSAASTTSACRTAVRAGRRVARPAAEWLSATLPDLPAPGQGHAERPLSPPAQCGHRDRGRMADRHAVRRVVLLGASTRAPRRAPRW